MQSLCGCKVSGVKYAVTMERTYSTLRSSNNPANFAASSQIILDEIKRTFPVLSSFYIYIYVNIYIKNEQNKHLYIIHTKATALLRASSSRPEVLLAHYCNYKTNPFLVRKYSTSIEFCSSNQITPSLLNQLASEGLQIQEQGGTVVLELPNGERREFAREFID